MLATRYACTLVSRKPAAHFRLLNQRQFNYVKKGEGNLLGCYDPTNFLATLLARSGPILLLTLATMV